MKVRGATCGFVLFLLTVTDRYTVDECSSPDFYWRSVWRVEYNSHHVCAIKSEKTVKISATYSYELYCRPYDFEYYHPFPHKFREFREFREFHRRKPVKAEIMNSFWFTEYRYNTDLYEVPQYAGRVGYHCVEQSRSCTLTITDLKEEDSAEYRFGFTTMWDQGTLSGIPGVQLVVTDLQVTATPSTVIEGQTVELSCHTKCKLKDNPTYIWYQNGLAIDHEERQQMVVGPVIRPHEKNYSCAVRGREDVRAPEKTLTVRCLLVTFTPATVAEGQRVTLTCNTDCSLPPDPTYIWHHNGRVLTHTESQQNYTVLDPVSIEDAGEYSCEVKDDNRGPGPQKTLTVRYGPKKVSLSVKPSRVIKEGDPVTLTCVSDANPKEWYTWYKEKKTIHRGRDETYKFSSISSKDSGTYQCQSSNEHGKLNSSTFITIDVQYAPRKPLVYGGPSGLVDQGSEVTLTCSSHANPPFIVYTWYRQNEDKPKYSGQNFTITNIQPDHRGYYYCLAQNTIERTRSALLLVEVMDGPKKVLLSVKPSGVIKEGHPVTLTCESDAKPKEWYTWHKDNETLHQGRNETYHFSSISSKDSGTYHCQSSNAYGNLTSSLKIDVQYAPKNPSVSVSPSAVVDQGTEVTLYCNYTDANPPVNGYTWYRQNKTIAKETRHTLIIPSFETEDSGNYSCLVKNKIGGTNSTYLLIVVTGPWIKIVAGAGITIVLLVPAFFVFRWARRKRASASQNNSDSDSDFEVFVPRAQDHPMGRQSDVTYSTVHFSQHTKKRSAVQPPPQPQDQNDINYSTVHLAQHKKKRSTVEPPPQHQDHNDIYYSTVHFSQHKKNQENQSTVQPPPRPPRQMDVNYSKVHFTR